MSIRPLPLAGVLRLGRPSDIWFKPATSVVVAAAIPDLTLLLLGRPDLVVHTMAGSFCALYAHHLPYAARARALVGVALGMLAGVAVALVTASLTHCAAVLVAVGALLAAVQKALCDATRIGPPGHLIFTFVSSASLFAPQTPAQVPGHLALTAGAAAVAWLVGMAPALVRPHGPERRATARALNAAAAHAGTRGTGPGHEGTRADAAAAVHAAWQSLPPAVDRAPARRSLERLVRHAETALAAPAAADPAQLRSLARALRGTGPVPHPHGIDDAADELLDGDAGPAPARRRLLPQLGSGSPLLPIALRTAVGCALAGYASLALGAGRPYWALVTAASLYQPNVTLTWSRGVQRVVGNLAGVLLFALIAPLAHLGHTALVLCCLAFSFGAEALIGRNYWLGSVCVTPMALLITEFTRLQQPGELVLDRVVDTVVGALIGVAAALAVTNRRAADHLEQAIGAAQHARERTEHFLAADRPDRHAVERARRRLGAALVELRATADAASGEWWQRTLPEERLILTERAGHRTLAAAVRRHGPQHGERLDVEGART
ncbi:FUSC family protein [Streptomyces sp. NPDC002004]